MASRSDQHSAASKPAQAEAQTETLHPDAQGLDLRADAEILDTLLDGQLRALEAVASAHTAIAAGAALLTSRLHNGGHLHYAAAGSSALMALADGAELPGTFGISADQISIHMAGGIPADGRMPGHTEDDAEAGAKAATTVTTDDVVIALSASGSTPFPMSFARTAQAAGAKVIAIANNADTPLLNLADVAICLPTPPEVIAGSTRMGAGTAQKAALNMMSTLAGIRLGHVMDGMMVNLIADNAKLRQRAIRIVSTLTRQDAEAAARALDQTGGAVKPAILLLQGAASPTAAETLLRHHKNNLRAALAQV
ncbi:N-acetylmuramic acid 6-phosphate etherase [Phaeobacter piscinae]|uniref:N-acetylmuramic acid 6-phosphate etherase MurQ n=1 Tax=Phaeobacter piscinae TaxID=1580596 RepID=A0ABM6PGA5_9RHOB|nr:N-acetylmuramic acid 6-phosphate etherase [Phaeobacter piscinae]ATG36689.1 N-acetylmuramic acid 6-phosphate etherase MurQ [Phaeobacter piscinae]ATG40623.1 N-acetylmuramic acid 6-phosphate etherase MurQ [Phaeobacter piscinae]AUQ87210.1 N-acetylmuramic acid 6-phosphate etherase MurQ [Phaeobacter piscinae]AUR25093.1 N-acetylmuramic acid 6-phosphate etherase MurQ [Phaeobacter piscinae]